MIQLIPQSPKIPYEIEQDLRDDNLVFFCGAGISAPSKLPDFDDLVEKVCKKLNVDLNNPLLKSAKKRGDYASVLDLLEGNQDFSVPPGILRKEIINILSDHNGKTSNHKALLDLSVLPDNKGHRLVTTNFDGLFLKAKPDLIFDSAPKLAPPRKEKWKNLTFLHGLIDEENDPEGKNLILTRTDFGLAYLHDNWAGRFIIQLFQDFKVLFIGYSINDPVMNYLISAISYENKRRQKDNPSKNVEKNQIRPSIYAFVGYKEDQKQEKENQWRSNGVEPIPYKITDKDNHSLLYETLKEWAEEKRKDSDGRKNWLKEKLEKPYKKETDKQKAEIVISTFKIDEQLAEYLPEINLSLDPKKRKAVDISWLKAFSEEEEESKNQNNISLLASRAEPKIKNSLLTKLTSRTAQSGPYPLWEALSPTEKNMAHWLIHHLDKKELIHWLIKKAPVQMGLIPLHPEFKDMIKWQLKHLEENSNKKLDKRKSLFWEIAISQKDHPNKLDRADMLIYELNEKGYSYAKMKKLLYFLEPQIGFETYFYDRKFSKILDPNKIYETKLIIGMDHYPEPSLKEDIVFRHAEDWTDLLKKAMELSKWAGLIQNGYDFSHVQRSSIANHKQNKTYHSWTYLIDLVRNSFDLTMEKDKKLAEVLLNKWKNYPYSLFYRLILYAVTKHSNLNEEIAVKLFEEKPAQTLWSPSCQNEVLKFLKDRKHSKNAIDKILPLIMKGLPQSLFKENIDENFFMELKERAIHLRLHHLKFSGVQLPKDIEKYYKKIPIKYSFTPSTKEDSDRDGFSFYTEEPTLLGSENRYHNMTDTAIFNDIKYTKPNTFPHEDWKRAEFQSFIKDFSDRAFKILFMFLDSSINSVPFWRAFIIETSNMTDTQKGNDYFLKSFKKIENFNDDFFTKCLSAIIYGFSTKGSLIYDKDKELFKKWWKRLWVFSLKEHKSAEEDSDMAWRGANSNLGRLSHLVFLILWSKFPNGKITKNGKIPEDIKNYFEIILKEGKKKDTSVLFHFGSYLSQLWYLDREWTITYIKALMSWDKQKILPDKKSQIQNSSKAPLSEKHTWKALWQGYLFQNMFLGPDFLEDFKKEFLNFLLNYKNALTGNYPTDYLWNIAGLFFTATGGRGIKNIFTDEESIKLIQNLDVDILEALSRKIWDLLKDTETNKKAVLWSEKIKPWIEEFWPAQKTKMNPKIAGNLSFIILHCGNKLPDAFDILKDKIKGIITDNSNSWISLHIIHQTGLGKAHDSPSSQKQSEQKKLKDSNKNNQTKGSKNKLAYIFDYPDELLQLLNWNFPKKIEFYFDEKINKILKELETKDPNIKKHAQYKELKEKHPLS